jgi:hypothetical protein
MLAENPCEKYTRERLEKLMAGRERISLLEVFDLDIPNEDKVWVACRPDAFAGQFECIVEKIVRPCVEKYALTHPATKEWAEKWLSGEDRTVEAARAATDEADEAYAAVEAAADAATEAAAEAARAAVEAAVEAVVEAVRATAEAEQVGVIRAWIQEEITE